MAQATEASEGGRERWKTVLYASFIAQMLSIIGFSASIPFIPLFLSQELGITNGAEAGLWSGTMGAVSSLTMAVLAPVWGSLADRYGRKSMVLRAMLGGSVLVAFMAVSNSVWVLFLLRVMQGALTGTVPANIALVASMTPRHRLGYALGLMSTAVFAGTSIGPLLGGTLADLFGHRISFVITSVALGLAALIVIFFVHEDFQPVRPDPNTPRHSLTRRMKDALGQKEFLAMLAILTLVQFANTVITPVLALFIKALNGTIDGAASLAGLELGITGIASALSATVAGRLSDRFGNRRVLVVSAVAASLLYLPQAAVTNVWQLLALRGAMGLFFGGILPSANALIAGVIPEGRKGAAYGLVSSASSLGFALGPITGAVIAAVLDTRAVFLVTALVLLAAAFWIRAVLAEYTPADAVLPLIDAPASLPDHNKSDLLK